MPSAPGVAAVLDTNLMRLVLTDAVRKAYYPKEEAPYTDPPKQIPEAVRKTPKSNQMLKQGPHRQFRT